MKNKENHSKKEKKEPTASKSQSSQPLIAGLAFYAQKIAKLAPSTSQKTAKASKPKEAEATATSTERKAAAKDISIQHEKKFSKSSDKGKEGKKTSHKPNFWWNQYHASNHTQLLVTPTKPWYEQYPSIILKYTPAKKDGPHESKFLALSDEEYHSLKPLFAAAYKKEIEQYQNELTKNGMVSDAKWLNSVISSGTWSDKIAALTLRIQESPFHNLETFDLLLGIADKKDLRVSFLALEAIKDLLIHNFLPDRSLRPLEYYRPILSASALKMECGMLLWYEHELKQRVIRILEIVDRALRANIIHFRKQALDFLSDLLIKKPEQEQKILIMIIDKLGDQDGTITTKTMDILKLLFKEHPAMKLVIIKEMKAFIYHPKTKLISIYHAIIVLLKIAITPKDPKEVPLQLVECYISLFDKAMNAEKNGSRLLSALLQGINKTFHLLSDVTSLNKYLDIIFKLVHTAPSFAAATQALVLLSHMAFSTIQNNTLGLVNTSSNTADAVSVQNRYYTTLYAKLLSDQVLSSTKNSLFLNLLFRSMKMDPSELRIAAFIKRILLLTTTTTAEVTASFLFIISEVLQARPELKPILDLHHTHKPSREQQLLTMKDSSNIDHYDDEGNEEHSTVEDRHQQSKNQYQEYGDIFDNFDPEKRNPLYACLNQSFPKLTEQQFLLEHYHPSVQAFAKSLFLDPSHYIHYMGDPLEEFSLMGFFNRFAYKNPKQKVIQELSVKQRRKQQLGDVVPVTEEFQALMKETEGSLDLDQIAPEKQFFFKYFYDREQLRAEGKIKPSRKAKSGDGDDEEVDEEDEIDAFADELAADMMRKDAKSRGEAFGDDEDFDEDDDGAFDDEEDDLGSLGEEDDEMDEDDEEELLPKSKRSQKSQGKGNKKRQYQDDSEGEDEGNDDDFANSAIEFEDFVKAQKDKNKNDSKKRDKKQRSKKREHDSDNDDYAEPEVYQDEMDLDVLPIEEEEEEDIGKSSRKKQKKSKKRKNRDEDAEDDLDDFDGNAFADAELYEEQMEENVKQYEFNPAALASENSNSTIQKKHHRNKSEGGRKNKKFHHKR